MAMLASKELTCPMCSSEISPNFLYSIQLLGGGCTHRLCLDCGVSHLCTVATKRAKCPVKTCGILVQFVDLILPVLSRKRTAKGDPTPGQVEVRASRYTLPSPPPDYPPPPDPLPPPDYPPPPDLLPPLLPPPLLPPPPSPLLQWYLTNIPSIEQSDPLKEGEVLVSWVFPNGKGAGLKLGAVDGPVWSTTKEDKLINLGVLLNSAVFELGRKKILMEESHLTFGTLGDIIEDACRREGGGRLFLRFFWALTTGKSDLPLFSEIMPDEINQVLTSYLAANMELRVLWKLLAPVHRYIGEYCETWGVAQAVKSLLCRMGVAADRTSQQRGTRQASIAVQMEGITLDPWSLAHLSFDNLGWKQLGAMVRRIEYVMFYWQIRDPPRLRDLCVYHEDPTRQLCRKKKVLDLKSSFAKKLLVPTSKDYNVMASCTMQLIEWALSLLQVPSLQDEIKSVIAESPDSYKVNTDKLRDEENMELGLSARSTFTTSCYAPLGPSSVDLQDKSTPPHTIYSANQVTVDLPLAENLNELQTVLEIVEYMQSVRTKQVDRATLAMLQPLSEREFPYLHSPICCDLPFMGMSDGNPVKVFHSHATKEQKIQVWLWAGGFHVNKEHLTNRAKLMAEVLTRTQVSGYRHSPDRQGFLLKPSDPREPNKEYLEIAIATIHEVALRIIEAKHLAMQLDPSSDSEQQQELLQITPVEVFDAMQERAYEHPLPFLGLFDFLQEVVSLMINDSCTTGREGDPVLYRTAKRFTTLTDSTTNAASYMLIMAEEAIHQETMSEAEGVIFDRQVFCKESRHGKAMAGDQGTEMMHLDVRKKEGKLWARTKKETLKDTAIFLPMRAAMRRGGKADLRRTTGSASSSAPSSSAATEHREDEGGNESFDGLSGVYLDVLRRLHYSELWKKGAAIKTVTGQASEKYCALDGKTKLNSKSLNPIETAIVRCDTYMLEVLEAHEKGTVAAAIPDTVVAGEDADEDTVEEGEPEREDVRFTTLKFTLADAKETLDLAVTRATTHDIGLMTAKKYKQTKQKLFSVAALKSEIATLRSTKEIEIAAFANKGSAKKGELAMELCLIRKELFTAFPNRRKEIISEIEKRLSAEAEFDFSVMRGELRDQPFYKVLENLSVEQRAEFNTKTTGFLITSST
jgi:hypothetical protein